MVRNSSGEPSIARVRGAVRLGFLVALALGAAALWHWGRAPLDAVAGLATSPTATSFAAQAANEELLTDPLRSEPEAQRSESQRSESQRRRDTRPNFLIIITDDQRYGTVGEYMPATQELIFNQGITFTKAYIPTPMCCPSRSAILTGLYAHNNGVFRNTDRLRYDTFMQRLKPAGYFTGIVGKYLNSWNGSARPEYDFWSVFTFGSATYFGPQVNTQGVTSKRRGYMTDVLRDDALRFLKKAATQQDKPFVLIFAPFSPHAPALPDTGDREAFSALSDFSAPSLGLVGQSSKPEWYGVRAADSPERLAALMKFRRKQLQSNLAVDRAVEQLIGRLRDSGELDNTVVLFISDNGILWGEHGLTGKACPYEEAVHVPMAVRYPPLIAAGRVHDGLVGNIDIAPTIYEMANVTPPRTLDGASLLPVFSGEVDRLRDDILLEGRSRTGNRRPYRALHTGSMVYIENDGATSELYDLTSDPYQLSNLINDPAYGSVRENLEGRLRDNYGRSGFVKSRRSKKRHKRSGD